MNIVFILLLQTLGTVIGGQVLLGRSDVNSKLQRRKDRKNKDDRIRTNERNESDGKKQTQDIENTVEKWVVDSIFYDDYQSDSPTSKISSPDVCPPVPDVVTGDACAQISCQQDTDCSDGYRCCFTGCSFTCLIEIKPAALVDWRKEPRRSRSGIAWLINDPGEPSSSEVAFEECSTGPVESDEDPLLCPHGYFCHVTDQGNPKKGIPNRGYCVKEGDETYSTDEEELVLTSALGERKTCKIDDIVLLDGANITLKRKRCRCKNGYLSCKKRTLKVKARRKRKPKHRLLKGNDNKGRNLLDTRQLQIS